MRLRRPLLLAAVFSAIAFAVVPNARATRFADQPCPESGPGAVRICPDGVVGQSYAIKLAGDAGCGPPVPVPSAERHAPAGSVSLTGRRAQRRSDQRGQLGLLGRAE